MVIVDTGERMKKANDTTGHKPGVEVQNYLDFLLQEATTPFELPGEPESENKVQPAAVGSAWPTEEKSEPQQQAQQIAARATPVETKPVLERPRLLPQIVQAPIKVAEPEVIPVETPVEVIAEVPQAEASEPASGNLLPDPFQCLLFDVGGLKLAVPLMELGAICQLLDPLTPLFGQPEWYLGIYSVQGRNIKVVDTGQWVLQDRYTPEVKEQYQYLLTFPEVEWGLAVSSIAEAVHIQQSEVSWRSVRKTSPWMAGVVRKHMCALLDMQQFEQCFSHTDKR